MTDDLMAIHSLQSIARNDAGFMAITIKMTAIFVDLHMIYANL